MKKKKIQYRALMEKAIEVMRHSINEHRDDGGTPPKVGAVLLKKDNAIETACRGELRLGDHAEFTLLERKNRSVVLEDCILFATLEPCGPEARKSPKLGCAERIVNARIKEVWVGIQDPHPKVAGKGIAFLKRHGVAIHYFDRDLQEIIQNENKQFIEESELKSKEEKRKSAVVLMEHEKVPTGVAFGDLSLKALLAYKSFLKINDPVESLAFMNRLHQQGILEIVGGKYAPTGYGEILFGEHPRDIVPEAGVLGTIQYQDGKQEVRDFDGPMVNVPEELLQWLKDKMPNPVLRNEARRKDENEKYYEIVRESIVNAIVHRDYSIKGTKCQVFITEDTVVVKSPGKPIDPITVEQLANFSAPMVSRNPMLHVVFGRMELAEERGLGLKSMKSAATMAGLPLPTYRWEAPYLVLTLYRNAVGAEKAIDPAILNSLNKAERAGWRWMITQPFITSSDYAKHFNIPLRTTQNHLKKFQGLALVIRTGKGPSTKFKIKP